MDLRQWRLSDASMTYQYKLTPLAASDIDEALDYISNVLLNPATVSKLYHAIQREITRICNNPYAFPDCSYYLIDDEMVRHSVIGNYVLIYEVDKTENTIIILRFLYGGKDITHMAIQYQE